MKKIFDYIICNYSVFLYSIVLLFFPFLFAFTTDGWDTSIRISLNLLYTCIVSIVLMLCQGNVRKILSILFLLVAFAPNMIVQSFILMGNNVILTWEAVSALGAAPFLAVLYAESTPFILFISINSASSAKCLCCLSSVRSL